MMGAEIVSFGEYPKGPSIKFENATWGSRPQGMYIDQDSSIWYAKDYFDNNIRIYRDTSLIKMIHSHTVEGDPYRAIFYSSQDNRNEEWKKGGFSSSGVYGTPDGTLNINAVTNALTISLFRYDNETIIHLISFRCQGKTSYYNLMVFLYDNQGRFLTSVDLGKRPGRLKCIDSKGNLYFSYYPGYHALMKMALVITGQ